jgi:hypothetical protein
MDREVDDVVDFFMSHSTGSCNVVDKDVATFTNIIAALSAPRNYIHWVGEGWSDPAGYPSLQVNDRLVTSVDLFEQPFTLSATQLFYLSTCYGMSKYYLHTENSFAYVLAEIKGASNVIGCRGALFDAAACQLAIRFYTYYANGMPMQDALSQASSELFNQFQQAALTMENLVWLGTTLTQTIVLGIIGAIFGGVIGAFLLPFFVAWLEHYANLEPEDMYNQFMADLGMDKMVLYTRTGGSQPPPGGGGGGGCPILSVYDGSGYSNEGLLNIHNSLGIDITTPHVIVSSPQAVDHRYLLRLTEHPKTISNIDQVKLYAVLTNGMTVRLPLLLALHSALGDITQQLRFSDDVRVTELGADHNNGVSESIDLQFVAPARLGIAQFLWSTRRAVTILYLLNALGRIDCSKTATYIKAQENPDFGFSMFPGDASSYLGCHDAVMALYYLGALNDIAEGSVADFIMKDYNAQVGTFSPGGLLDQEGRLELLSALGAISRIDSAKMEEFVLSCQSHINGGFVGTPDYVNESTSQHGDECGYAVTILCLLNSLNLLNEPFLIQNAPVWTGLDDLTTTTTNGGNTSTFPSLPPETIVLVVVAAVLVGTFSGAFLLAHRRPASRRTKRVKIRKKRRRI